MARYNLSQIQSLLRQVGFPENQIAKAAAIVMYESGGNSDAINDGSSTNSVEYSVGLLQINTRAHKNYSVAQLKDPIINLTEALRIWRGRPNWQDWYNSNKKYNSNYKGIAAQSQAIYNAGGNNVQVITSVQPSGSATISQVPADNIVTPTAEPEKSNTTLYVALGMAFLVLIRFR
jgi:hypothetical protein